MENASKALIMAAEVLIGVLLISFAIYIYSTYNSITSNIESEFEAQYLYSFNMEYLQYQTKESLTIHDVISIANLATQNNVYYNLQENNNNFATGDDSYISVVLNNSSIEGGSNTDLNELEKEYQELITNDLNEITDIKQMATYNVNILTSEKTGRVYRIDIKNN